VAVQKKTFRQELAEVSKDVGRPVGAFLFVVVVVTGLRYVPSVIWPSKDVKVLSVQTDASDGQLSVTQIELRNSSSFELKDPEIGCDMKGPSGTTIKKASKVIYEVLPRNVSRSFFIADMAKVPDQVTDFNCYVKSASVKW
jgi:hypothetical protein